MRRYSPDFPSLVNAAIVSMGRVVNHKGGFNTDLSPEQTVTEETKVELRQRYVCYEEARRQLEFLEQGGDPLDFRPRNSASLSVQSTSLTDQHPEQFVVSEAKDSFALAASPPGDSVESSGRPGAPPACEPNSADNLMLFDGENDDFKCDGSLMRSSRSIVVPSEHSSQLNGSQHAKESGDSAAFGLPKKAYKRRNRSRHGRSSSTDVVVSSSGHTALPSRLVPREPKGLAVVEPNQKDQAVTSNSNFKPTNSNFDIVHKAEPSNIHLDIDSNGGKALELIVAQATGCNSDSQTDPNAFSNIHDNQHNKLTEFDTQISHKAVVLHKPESHGGSGYVSLGGLERDPSLAVSEAEVQDTCRLTNGLSGKIGDKNGLSNEVDDKDGILDTKILDMEPLGTGTGVQVKGNFENETFTKFGSVDSNGYIKEDPSQSEEILNMEGKNSSVKHHQTEVDIAYAGVDVDQHSFHSHQGNGSLLKENEALTEELCGLRTEPNDSIANEGKEQMGITSLENEIVPSNLSDSNPSRRDESTYLGGLPGSIDSSVPEIPDTTRDSNVSPEQRTCSQDLKLEKKVHDDSILEEARIIEAKRKRIAELSVHKLRLESCQKSHWAFVLEEMAWMANDFAQERLWKISAAAQMGRRASAAARLKLVEQDTYLEKKVVARNLAKAVMEFWCLVQQRSKEQELQQPGKDCRYAVQRYALRFLQYNSSTIQYVPAELCTVPDSISSPEIVDRSWKDLTEENLFYSIPSGAIESYRISIESEVLHWEKTGICMQEVQTSGYEALTEYGSRGYTLEEDEEETSAYYMTGAFENGNPIKLAREKKKHLMNEFAARSYEMGSDSTLMQSYETKAGHQSVLIGKRPSNTLNVSIPTKRVRTAPRQRVLSPFNVGTHGCLQGPNKTDASSGDTNSFQDDRNISQGGSSVLNNMEVESVRNFDRQLPVDSSEVSHKPKKIKKEKNLGSSYEYNWRSDSSFQNEQRDNHKRRLESHHIESNGSSGLYGQHIGKKSKFNKQTLDNSVDNVAPVNCSISSPVASQMSNMSNPSKFIKMLGGRDRGRKTKGPKGASGQPDSGTSWSLFEDQALVVLVHDMGPNWNLVSDAFNSTLKFKCIFRKPKECMDRHKVLMDSPAGEGADSADDSGSSQPYRSTLPGIPKGSARQLFQRLQGPIEEDTIKSHLEKIIAIGKKQHQRRAQDPRQLQQPHNSHTYALSQVCPNNLNGGPILTPLDLLDTTSSSPDVLPLGYQSPHAIGLPNSNQGSVSPMLPASGANPSSQASTSAVPGSNFSSASSQLNASVRDGRSGIPRSTDEQQRLQQYNQMLASRNFQQNNTPISGVHSGSDRGGVHILTGGNGVGNPSGMNRSIAVPRPGHQGIASSSLVVPGSVLSSGVMAVPNPVNIHSGSGQGKSMMRPRDSMHMMRPTQNVEHQRPMMIPELKGQVSQGNSQGISPFGAISSSFSNQTTPPSVPSYLLHHQQVHPMSTQQSHVLTNTHHPHLHGPNVASNTQLQAYAIRIAKEKHIQQQLLLQKHQQQQYAASNSLVTHVPGQPQLKVSSPQNSSQAQTTSPQVSLSPLPASSSLSSLSQNSQKHHIPPHIVGGNPQVSGSGLTNQVSKQRQPQHQQFQQSGRQHPQQRHQSHSQHQAKNLKGAGRGNVVHQNHPTDSTVQNGPVGTTESHTGEVGEQSIRTIQGQGLYSGAGLNSVQPQKQLVPSHISHQPQPQQKSYSGQTISSKQLQLTHAHSESSNQNHVLPAAAGPTSISSQAVSLKQQPHQQSHPQPKLVNRTQTTVQRLLQQNRQVNSDHVNKLQAKDAHAGMHNVNSFSPIVSTAPVPSSVDVANVEQAVTSASTPQQKTSEQVSDPSVSNPATLIGSSGTLPSTNPPTQILPPVCLGIENIQSSGSLPDVGYDSAVQWSEEHPQLQPHALPPPLEQQQVESKQQSEEHLPLLQEGGSSS